MHNKRKLNSVQAKNEMVLWMVMGPILLIMLFLFGFAVLFLTPVFFIYSIVSALLFFRTLNTGYMVKGMMFFFLTLFTLLVFLAPSHMFTLVAAVISGLLLVWLVILVAVRDLKWRNLHVLELAAMPVEDVEEGYSMRPMPTAKITYTPEQLLAFAGFIRRNLVAVVYFEKDKVVFGLNRHTFKMISFSSHYINDTWVSFDREGNVSVHIAREDYEQFSEAYAFDQLCDSLGTVFAEFFALERAGRGQEIIRKLDDIRL